MASAKMCYDAFLVSYPPFSLRSRLDRHAADQRQDKGLCPVRPPGRSLAVARDPQRRLRGVGAAATCTWRTMSSRAAWLRALDGIRVMGYRGLSVTIPHKVEAMDGVDEVDETARVIGCINTVVNENGRLWATIRTAGARWARLREAGADPAGTTRADPGFGRGGPGVAVTLAREAPPAAWRCWASSREELERLAADVRRPAARRRSRTAH